MVVYCNSHHPSIFLYTLLNKVTFLVKTPKIFEFQPLAIDILEQGIKVVDEDVLYNWIDSNIMKISSSKKPFCVAKEMHAFMLHA
jgi:hypothetical protein